MNIIKFEIGNEYNNFLSKIFNHFDEKDYVWEILDSEVLINADQVLFEKEYYDNDSFKKIINEKKYYIIFLKIKLYKSSVSLKNINKSNEILKSDWELLLDIVDSTYVDVYTKNKTIFDIIYNNAIENNFSNINIIENGDKDNS